MVLNSNEFSAIKCTSQFIPESNDLSLDADENTPGEGLFISPSLNIPGRDIDISGYVLASANTQGKVEWSKLSDLIVINIILS